MKKGIDEMANKVENVGWFDREWECPLCGSTDIDSYDEIGDDTVDVICGHCDGKYRIFDDIDPQDNGNLLGFELEDRKMSYEDMKAEHDDRMFHEARDEGRI